MTQDDLTADLQLKGMNDAVVRTRRERKKGQQGMDLAALLGRRYREGSVTRRERDTRTDGEKKKGWDERSWLARGYFYRRRSWARWWDAHAMRPCMCWQKRLLVHDWSDGGGCESHGTRRVDLEMEDCPQCQLDMLWPNSRRLAQLGWLPTMQAACICLMTKSAPLANGGCHDVHEHDFANTSLVRNNNTRLPAVLITVF
jgi:hypothetical protein